MSVSQFKFYSSDDPSAPQLSGSVGTLLAIFDACLVNGYGSRVAAGWTKPIANSGNTGHYKQGAGAGFFLYVNDNGPQVSATYKEAWATGWRTMSALTAPVGVGVGQFPLPAMLLTTGRTVIAKSTVLDTSARSWKMYADASTFYFFIQTVPTVRGVSCFWFGDIYSLGGSADANRCMINGRLIDNNQTTYDGSAETTDGMVTVGTFAAANAIGGTGNYSGYLAGTAFGLGQCERMRLSSFWQGWFATGGVIYLPFSGYVAAPNAADLGLYLSPIRVHDASQNNYRGRARGLWATAHSASSFTEGQVITGANETVGKTFAVMKTGAGGAILVETSNTVETN